MKMNEFLCDIIIQGDSSDSKCLSGTNRPLKIGQVAQEELRPGKDERKNKKCYNELEIIYLIHWKVARNSYEKDSRNTCNKTGARFDRVCAADFPGCDVGSCFIDLVGGSDRKIFVSVREKPVFIEAGQCGRRFICWDRIEV